MNVDFPIERHHYSLDICQDPAKTVESYYAVTNKTTGVTEFKTPIFIQAFQFLEESEKFFDDVYSPSLKNHEGPTDKFKKRFLN